MYKRLEGSRIPNIQKPPVRIQQNHQNKKNQQERLDLWDKKEYNEKWQRESFAEGCEKFHKGSKADHTIPNHK